jgi:hypothetical protein
VVRHRPCLLLVGASLELLVRDALFSLLGGALALRLDALGLVEGMKKNRWGGMGELKKIRLIYLFATCVTGLSLAVNPDYHYLSGKCQNRQYR